MAKKEQDQLMEYSLRAFPLGENTVQLENSHSLQLADPSSMFKDDSIPQLASAINVDIDNYGVPKRRAGLTEAVDLGLGISAISAGGYLYVQDSTVLKCVDLGAGTTTTVVPGLSTDKIQFLEHAGKVFWTNGTDKGMIGSDCVNYNWGMTTPPVPTISASSGSLRAGRYLVTCTLVDAQGVESTAPESAPIELTSTGGISVDLSSVDSNAVYVKVYTTSPNSFQEHWNKTVAVGSLPTTVTAQPTSYEPLRTQNLSPPIPATTLFAYRGMLIFGIENGIFPSVGDYHHIYDIKNNQNYFPSNVVGGAGMDKGFWTATEQGMYWTTGTTPETWDTTQVDAREYARGSIILPGYLFPVLKQNDEVAFFLSEHGLMVGTQSGNLMAATEDRLHTEVKDKTASFAYRKKDEIRQLLFTLE